MSKTRTASKEGEMENATQILGKAECLIARVPRLTARAVEYVDLAGEDSQAYYKDVLDALERVAEVLRDTIEEVSGLSTHAHQWGENDYCIVCGADGRA